MWVIEKVVSKGDYNYAVVKDHPNSIDYGYVLEHRVVMENHLGRLLEPDEVVHHLNHNKKDNRVENLEVMKASEHGYHHSMDRLRKYVEFNCVCCGVVFSREHSLTRLVKGGKWTTCSRSCNGRFSKIVQQHGITTEMQQAIDNNIIRIFYDKH